MSSILTRSALLITGALSITSCASSAIQESSSAVAGSDYALNVEPNDAASRFELTLTSKSARRICFAVDDWPNSLGQVTGGGGRALLRMDGQELPAAETNFGYCVGQSCQVQVQAGTTVSGYINYKEFGAPDRIRASSNKTLEYQVRPYFCPKS